MKKRTVVLIGMAVAIGLVFGGVNFALAKVSGQCATCHTMHASQDGASLGGPNETLLTKGCVACHTGTNSSTSDPFVLTTTDPGYDPAGVTGKTLAGGNFYWVSTAGEGKDSSGHNVATDSLSAKDVVIGTSPPGFNAGTDPSSAEWSATQLTCSGTNGCHGTRTKADEFADISGAHHANETGSQDGTSLAKSYRFLNKITGYEDGDYELPASSGGTAGHNMYSGVDRTDVSTLATTGTTISAFCAQCHGDFHSGADGATNLGIASGDNVGNSWLRHPTDYDMGNAGGEYVDYNGIGGLVYSLEAPVGATATLASSDVVSAGTANGTAIVTCLSCHRAHGSPYADILRWDYMGKDTGSDGIVAGGGAGNVGCFICHTTKDD